jgi:hypothetical protein
MRELFYPTNTAAGTDYAVQAALVLRHGYVPEKVAQIEYKIPI